MSTMPQSYDDWRLATPPHYDTLDEQTEKLESSKWLLSTLEAVGRNYVGLEIDGVAMNGYDTLECSMHFQIGDDIGLANALEKMAAVIRSIHDKG